MCVGDELKKVDWVFIPGLCFVVYNFRTSFFTSVTMPLIDDKFPPRQPYYVY